MAARTRQAISVVADINGEATFEFQAPPPGYVITGSVGLPLAPTTAVATLTIGPAGVGVTWGSWTGNSTFGPVQAFGQETMSVEVSGLTPGSFYEAIFIGYSEQESPSTTIIYPSAIATAVASSPVVTSIGNLLDFRLIRKNADQSLATTVATIDSELVLAVNAGETWECEIVLAVQSASDVPDIALGFTAPGGSAGWQFWHGLAQTIAGTDQGDMRSTADQLNQDRTFGVANTGQAQTLLGKAVVLVGVAGNISLRWAQGNVSATAVTVKEHSYLVGRRVL